MASQDAGTKPEERTQAQTLTPQPKPDRRPDRVLITGTADLYQCDNKVISARYTLLSFLPVALMGQFRRFANCYFLIIGVIMFIGTYTPFFTSGISPWTTLGPLAFVVTISLIVEANTDYKRHKNDAETNNTKCVVLSRSDDLANHEAATRGKEKAERDEHIMGGKDVVVNLNKAFNKADTQSIAVNASNVSNVKIAFQKVKRKEIRQGHFVLVKNREMVPADLILLASSNDQGCAYIETSSIDGETNLKLRISPTLPKNVMKSLSDSIPLDTIAETDADDDNDDSEVAKLETIDAATKRLTRFSALGYPDGISVLYHPSIYNKNKKTINAALAEKAEQGNNMLSRLMHGNESGNVMNDPVVSQNTEYVATLISEPPNPSVHTFSGKLTFPPLNSTRPCTEIPLGAENVLLRGAVIRNTEWVIGLAFFTGPDTKLVQNSFRAPSKFSQLEILMNKTVMAVLTIMILIITYLATSAVYANEKEFDSLFYVGFNRNPSAPWPYLPELAAPEWKTSPQNWIQFFLMYVTLMSNFIPLSLYVTIELVTFCMLYFVYTDKEMYDPTTNTRAVARSTIISDLGRIQYIFSDKTGTLTQNVMRFKRCSVDGIVFGAPISRSKPSELIENGEDPPTAFLPVRQLLVGKVPRPTYQLAGLNTSYTNDAIENVFLDKKLTFNAEMFLRVMSLCHTVVVEKDIDKKENIDAGQSLAGSSTGKNSISQKAKNMFRSRKSSNTGGTYSVTSPLSSVAEESPFPGDNDGTPPAEGNNNRSRLGTATSIQQLRDISAKSDDGAPIGYAYQAESPDEGALVSAASSLFGFQVIARDTNGIRLRCNVPSHFQDLNVMQKLEKKQLTLKRLAAETVSVHDGDSAIDRTSNQFGVVSTLDMNDVREETWSILAVNKFDSDRKRMSMLLRAPPELGGLPILFCKGADSSMIDPDVCENYHLLGHGNRVQGGTKLSMNDRDVSALSTLAEDDDEQDSDFNQEEWDMSQMLSVQVHLGEFAKEGLRTLVLGMKVLSERECSEWLELYKAASTSMIKRSELLTEAAKKIETGLHIVGATAIEDKLQVRVPETIATLGKAGIKLWVLTGDKRETAVEIGYSTHVLTPKMHLTEIPDEGKHKVRVQAAMEFIRLTKIGKLPQYQRSALDGSNAPQSFKQKIRNFSSVFFFKFGICRRALRRLRLRLGISFFTIIQWRDTASNRKQALDDSMAAEKLKMLAVERRRKVRARAEKTIRTWLHSEEGLELKKSYVNDSVKMSQEDLETALSTDETPLVFTRATSAQAILTDMKDSGGLSTVELRQLSLAHMTATQVLTKDEKDKKALIDEDTLSLESFAPAGVGDPRGDYDKRKRTILERFFAVDREVRKGRLKKHFTKERLQAISEGRDDMPSLRNVDLAIRPDAIRALVIEGAALKHLLGEPDFEEILFAVASSCESVIACRVSPKQKAELVNLVRRNIRPEPITLAIGDGANDVGMIQEAHVGVGISGKEGKQAVNASDFSISQFRFLETLILIHGRWNFFRLSIVVMFSFYKNTVMAGLIIIYSAQTVYSGTPLFDEWVIAMLNFVCAFPIIMTGLFDRCLSKDYVRDNPEVYRTTRENELITFRSLLRWVCLVFVHMNVLYYFTVPQQALGGGMTTAFVGLMRNNNRDWPGDGEGSDLKSVGTVTYTCMILLFAYKVLYETRSLVHGRWPAFTCRKGVGEGFLSRLAYTWIAVTFLSIIFYFLFIIIYSLLGRQGPSEFSSYVSVGIYMMTTRSMSWMLIAFVPVMGMVFDISGKVFSNMFFPTQTQIHLEIESKAKMKARMRGKLSRNKLRKQERERFQEEGVRHRVRNDIP